MSKLDEKISCTRYISDFTGHDISPGNVVGVGRGTGKSFEANIVTAISKGRIYFAGYKFYSVPALNEDGTPKTKMVKWGSRTYNQQVYDTEKKLFLKHGFSILDKKEEIQSHISLVSEPLFAIHNSQIKGLIELADALKDKKLFPSDYKLGQSLVEYEEEEEG